MTMIASAIIKNANIREKNRSMNTDSGWHFHSYQKKNKKTKKSFTPFRESRGEEKR
jgi:hypothetical protein